MINKHKYKIVTLLLVPFVAYGLISIVRANEASAGNNKYGGLVVDTGVGSGKPLFEMDDFKPGDCVEREIKVKNEQKEPKSLTVRSMNVAETGNLSSALTMLISSGETVFYNDTLKKFFEDSQTLDGIVLDSIDKSTSKTYSFKVCFDITAGNELQKKQVQFDLVFGDVLSPVELPEECKHLQGIITSVIHGDNSSNKINGTHASELIFGYEGNNRIDGGAGHDCIVVGGGNNRIDGGAGNDVIITGDGNNRIDGGAGNDTIYVGHGNDRVDGGAGNDLIIAKGGNNRLDGGAGNDKIFGGAGNDTINGGAGDDYLDGGGGHNKLNGNAGNDTCTNGPVYSSCETIL